jgi:hypothetical protein
MLAIETTGFSDSARYLSDAHRQSLRQFDSSAAYGKQPAYDELAAVWEECRTPNWDGRDAHAVEPETLHSAYRCIEALPLGCPLPSVGAEPDGHITLEWYSAPRCTLSVSISPDSMLYYAALFGASDVRGSEPFFGDVPKMILILIHRVHHT